MKNFLLCSLFFFVGACSVVAVESVAAPSASGVSITKTIKSVYVLSQKQGTAFENIFASDLCKEVVKNGVKKCDIKNIRSYDMWVQYVDNDMDGKKDSWRIEATGNINGTFTAGE